MYTRDVGSGEQKWYHNMVGSRPGQEEKTWYRETPDRYWVPERGWEPRENEAVGTGWEPSQKASRSSSPWGRQPDCAPTRGVFSPSHTGGEIWGPLRHNSNLRGGSHRRQKAKGWQPEDWGRGLCRLCYLRPGGPSAERAAGPAGPVGWQQGWPEGPQADGRQSQHMQTLNT